MNRKFYITTAIPYVNAVPHLGFALEIVQADVLARYHRLKSEDVFFSTGTDENALKNVLAAEEKGIGVRELVDENAQEFRNLKEILNLSWDDFIRTTESRHVEGAKKFWLATKEGDIYKKQYKGLYCVGCEEFKTPKDLVNDCCPEHPSQELELIEEENYFFRLSAYQDSLEDLIATERIKIIPKERRNEILAFIEQGLRDFSISRSQERMRGWGISVPGDDTQRQYVWFDALTNYITALGYAENSEKFQKYWQNNDFILHVIGKGVARFHAIYWPAMLLSAGIRLPTHIFIHGYLTIDGQKISKSLGNVISPSEVVKKYGIDPVRYYLLREMPSYEDGDFSYRKFEERYNGELANGLGNLVARVAALGEKISPIQCDFEKDISGEIKSAAAEASKNCELAFSDIRLNEALAEIWRLIGVADRYINEAKPWVVNDVAELQKILANAGYVISTITNLLRPFLPETAERIGEQIRFDDAVLKIKRGEVLFPRLPS